MTLPAEWSRDSTPVRMKAVGWLANDHSAQAARWYVCSPVSGEQLLVVPLRYQQIVGDVSAHSGLITSLRNEAITTQRLWREVTSPRTRMARTRLGERLLELREKYRASGERLLDWDAIAREIQERRGEQNMGDLD
jgi:hypothetical protein